MSGNGGDSPYSPPDEPDCSKLRVRTTLSSPVATVVSKFKIGEILNVKYKPPKGPLQVETKSGVVAGSIITSKQVDIINCISKGFSFVAEVLSIKGGKCDIEIKPGK